MIRFALKNLAIKKIQTILVILSIVISAGVVVLIGCCSKPST